MYKSFYVGLVGVAIFFSGGTELVQAESCVQKQRTLEAQLNDAKQQNNGSKIESLTRALVGLSSNCQGGDAQVSRIIKEKEFKVQEAYQELQDAKTNGSSERISQVQGKLRKAQYELSEAKAAL